MEDKTDKLPEAGVLEEIQLFRCPRWEQLPEIDLYIDQTVSFLERYLQPVETSSEEKTITGTMINNYVKQKVIDAPVKKKYNRTHLASLFVLCILKKVFSIGEVDKMMKILQCVDFPAAYNRFCTALEDQISLVFSCQGHPEHLSFSGEAVIKSAIIAFSHKLFTQKCLQAQENLQDKKDG